MIFSTQDVFGGTVVLYRDRMEQHIAIVTNHTDMAGQEIAIQRTVEDPDTVYKSARHPDDTKMFFGLRPESAYPLLYTTVVVRYVGNFGTVRTAYFTKQIRGVAQGGLIYVKGHS